MARLTCQIRNHEHEEIGAAGVLTDYCSVAVVSSNSTS